MEVLRRAGVVLVVVLLVIVLAVIPVADAKKKKKKKRRIATWNSSVTLTHPATTQFSGHVGSKLNACEKDRLVTLYYTDPDDGAVKPLAVQRTGGAGNYQMDLPVAAFPGSYQVVLSRERVVVTKRNKRTKRTTTTTNDCKGSQSSVVTVS
jgi:hypothetical protein